MKKDIGIITHLYKSTNYGGVLQAYALCKYLNEQGYSAEQIQYEKKELTTVRKKVGKIYRTLRRIGRRMRNVDIYEKIESRKIKFEKFKQNNICQSSIVYKENNLKQVSSEYRMFITGSDQVWHPNAVCNAYLLSFGLSGVKKISYAASVAKDSLTKEQSDLFREAFEDFQAISVREKSTVDLLQPLSPVDVQWVLDPVFLLSSDVWSKSVGEKINRDKYVFCYFLGESIGQREVIRDYAKKQNLNVVSLAYLNNDYNVYDEAFPGEKVIDADPMDFVRLIRDAEVIFTDSFHAMAFSLIFKKEFWVFERESKSTMSSRILSLAELYGVQNRFLDDEQKLDIDTLINMYPIDYEHSKTNIKDMQLKSTRFLKYNIGACLGES